MSIEVVGPDGGLHTFPDGTSDDDIRNKLKAHYGITEESTQARQSVQHQATAAAVRNEDPGRRTVGARAWDNAVDAFQTSLVAEGYRDGFRMEAEGPRDFADQLRMQTSNGMTDPFRAIGRASAGVQRLFGRDVAAISQENLSEEKERRQEFERKNSEGDSFLRYGREGDYIGLMAHGGAALGGVVGGSLLDPTNYVGWGRTVLARAASQFIVAGAGDAYAQEAGINAGLEEDFSISRLGLSALVGGGFSLGGDLLHAGAKQLHDRFFRNNDADIAPDLDLHDSMNIPPLHEGERPSSPYEATRTVMFEGEEITLRGEGSPIELVDGGVRPGDYVEDGRVWRINAPQLDARSRAEVARQGPADEDLSDWIPEEEVQLPPGDFLVGLNGPKPVSLEEAGAASRYIDPQSELGQQWHEGNKLLDEAGKPLVFHHGNFKGAFEKFANSKKGQGAGGSDTDYGFFLSTSPRTAKSYAGAYLNEEGLQIVNGLGEEALQRLTKSQEFWDAIPLTTLSPHDPSLAALVSEMVRGGQIDLYVNELVNNAKDGDGWISHDAVQEAFEGLRPLIADLRAKAQAVFDDDSLNPPSKSGWIGQFQAVMKNPYEVDHGGRPYSSWDYEDYISKAKAGGHDGIIIRNSQDGGGAPSDIYIFPDADQVRPLIPRAQAAVKNEGGAGDTRWDQIDEATRSAFLKQDAEQSTQAVLDAYGFAGTVTTDATGTTSIHLDNETEAAVVADQLAKLFETDVTVYSREPNADFDAVEITAIEIPEGLSETLLKDLRQQFPDASVTNGRLITQTNAWEVEIALDALFKGVDFTIETTTGHARVSKGKPDGGNAEAPQSEPLVGDHEGHGWFGELQARRAEALEAFYSQHGQGKPDPEPAGRPGGDAEADEGVRVRSDEGVGGDGQNGWADVDWGKRGEGARFKAALAHLDKLQKAIKPEAVAAFVRMLDDPLPKVHDSLMINREWVDWSKFKSAPEELLGLADALGDIFSDVYEAAGVKYQSHAQLKRLAANMGITYTDLIKTHADVTGANGISVRLFALRDVFNAAADDAHQRIAALQAKKAEGVLRPEEVQELAEVIQRVMILGAMDKSASGEVARALRARREMSKPKVALNDFQKAMDFLNTSMGDGNKMSDPNEVFNVLDELAKAYEKGGAGGMRGQLKKMREMTVADYFGYAIVANLLSGLTTHIKNVTGTPIHATFDLSSRLVAGTVVAPARRAILAAVKGGQVLQNTSSVHPREAFAYVQGNLAAFGEAFQLGLKGLVKGAPVTDGKSSVIDDTGFVPFAFSKERMEQWQRSGFSPKALADMAGVLYFETVRTLGFRLSVAGDEFNKAFARRGELHALAYRRAAEASAKAGGDKKVFTETFEAILKEPTAEAFAEARTAFADGTVSAEGSYLPGSKEAEYQQIMASIDVRELVADHAQLLAFQKTGPVLDSIEKTLRRMPLIKHFSVNFLRTPTQILQAAFRDYNPVTAPFVLAVEHLGAGGRQRHKAFIDALMGDEAALAGGGAEAEKVIAKQLVGAGAMLAMWGLWENGDIVGEQVPPGAEYAGVKPYSVKLPNGTWVQYTGFSPVAELLGTVADFGHIMREKDLNDDQEFALMGALAVAVRNNVYNKSFLKGLSDLMGLMEGGSFPGQDAASTEKQMSRSAQSLILGRVIPGSSFLRRLAQDVDPVVRDTRSWAEAVTAYIPGRTESLAAKRDFMGRPVIRKPGERGALQVSQTSRPSQDALEVELHRLVNQPNSTFRIEATPRSIDGHEMSTHEYSRLVEIQGQLVERNGMNMEEALRDLISSDRYREAPVENQGEQLKKIVREYRAAGKKAAFDPDSPLFIETFAQRTGVKRLEAYAKTKGVSVETAFNRRGRAYGVRQDDLNQLAEALETIEE